MFPPCDLPGLNYGGCNEDNGDLLQKVACRYCYTQCPQPCSRPPLIHTSADSWTLMGKSGSVSCGVTASFSGSWCIQGSACAHQEFTSQFSVSSCGSMVGLMATSSKRAYAIPKCAAPKTDGP